MALFSGVRTGEVVTTATTGAAPPPDFRTLAMQVRAAGLLERRRGYYGATIALTIMAFGAGWAAFFVLGASWAALGVGIYLGLISTQLGFLGHDAGHGQVFASRWANRALGLAIGNGLIGLSLGWWVAKHNAHHLHPNQLDRDPDIGAGLVGAHSKGAASGMAGRLRRWPAKWQAELFFPLMLLRSAGLYLSGFQDLRRRRDRGAITERLLLGAHGALYLTAVLWVLPPTKAIAFIAVHQAVFSLYLGCSFAPNHKGMPIVERDSEMSFAERQVTTSRNLTGGRRSGVVFGGLNYQIEHHLFPTMPRPNLARAQGLVRSFCVESGLGYCEESPFGSYRRALRHLKAVPVTALLGPEKLHQPAIIR